ncbi:MAG: agmatine deiminase family protein [Myxococcales bacterium]|nr:agmatine deiminase family protein [Myxococcales bacterium]
MPSLPTRLVALLAGGLALGGCAFDDSAEPQPTAPEAAAPLAPEGFDVPVSQHQGLRPAWETDAEKRRVKDDGFDVRGTYQDIYGYTAAPNGGARALAEFEQTDGVLMAWEGDLSPFLADVVGAIGDAAPVYIVTPDVGYSEAVRDYLRDAGVRADVRFYEFQHEAFWTRDYGPQPIELRDGRAAFVDAAYYPDRRRDDAIPTLMSRSLDTPVFRPEMATEGGNFMTNGEGLCVVTEWLLEENAWTSRPALERIKRDYYGCARLEVLERLEGEGTGHVDMFAKFTTRDTVLVGTYDRRVDPTNAAILDRNAERLAAMTLADGTPLRVIRIPMPRPTYPVYRSYTNAVIVNDVVVVPTYRTDRTFEAQALAAYREAFPPNYRIVPVDSEDPIQLGGAIHCTTMGFALGAIDGGAPPPEIEPEPEVEPVDAANAYTAAPDIDILDNRATIATITVDAEGDAGDLTVDLDIAHTYIGDLRVTLTHGDVEVVLHGNAGGGADDLVRSYAVSAFRGLDRQGEWVLRVEDSADADQGRLRAWGLAFR